MNLLYSTDLDVIPVVVDRSQLDLHPHEAEVENPPSLFVQSEEVRVLLLRKQSAREDLGARGEPRLDLDAVEAGSRADLVDDDHA